MMCALMMMSHRARDRLKHTTQIDFENFFAVSRAVTCVRFA